MGDVGVWVAKSVLHVLYADLHTAILNICDYANNGSN